MRIAHEELVDLSFMTKLTDLPEQLQELIKSAEFNIIIVGELFTKKTPRVLW